MYCVQCGVELADSEKKCPLCGMVVFHPEMTRPAGEAPFPANRPRPVEKVNRSGIMFILTVLFVLPVVVVLLCDWRINGAIVWSGYVSGAILAVYIIVMLPLWFHAPNPVIFLPTDFAVVALYLLYVNYAVGGHWFLSFALPITLSLALLVCGVTALLRYVRRGYLFIFGGAAILTGLQAVLIEYLLHLTFQVDELFFWSFFPLAAGVILGLMLIIIGLCPPLRESLRRKFFL